MFVFIPIQGAGMTAKLRYFLPFLVALSTHAQAEPPQDNSGFEWPSHYDFFLPYGTRGGGPVYAKPGYKGVNLTLTCREATGLLKLKGYKDIEELGCSGSTYRFEVSRADGRFVIELDPGTGDIIRRRQL